MAMLLSADTIRLGATPANKTEAIELAGLLLVDSGHIESGYIASMMGREKQANTFLGHGIAIPHGMAPDRHLIKETGVAVVQVPQGVEWNKDERVDLIVAIAAKSDEHLQILASLMDVMEDEALVERLSRTTSADEIAAALNGKNQASETLSPVAEGMSVQVPILSHAGLHARPATFLAHLTAQFQAEISLEYQGRIAPAKSTISVLKLGVPFGETVRIIADGPDAPLALERIKEAFKAGLGDEIGEAASESVKNSAALPVFTAVSSASFIAGIAAAPGFAIAPLYFWRQSAVKVADESAGLEIESGKLDLALKSAEMELKEMAVSVEATGAKADAAIFEAQAAFLEDPELRADTLKLLKAGHGAAWSWDTVIHHRVEDLRMNPNPRLAERSADLQDIGARVLRLLGVGDATKRDLPAHPVILVADDLTPSQTASLNPAQVLGICTALGGPTSHTAILASSLNLPAVVGAGATVMELGRTDGFCILDGLAGRLYTNPTEEDLQAAHKFKQELLGKKDLEFNDRFRPALMRDGTRVEIVANIGDADGAAKAMDMGAEGVGLLRTELLFLGRDAAPTEDEQFEAISAITQVLGGLPLIVRTLDIGGDKGVSYLDLPHEENPFLGVRGARLTLRNKPLFETQLRAIFRASETGSVSILFPMIGTLEEWREARSLAEKVRLEVGALEVEYGVMIEVPSAALMAAEFAREVDFFSVGTNDLTQYTLAIDRLHPELGKGADALHPAVLRLIAMTVEAASAEGKWVGVCGGVAGEPLGALILIGLGVTELSMGSPAIPTVKSALRKADLAGVKALAQRALKCGSAAEVRALGGVS